MIGYLYGDCTDTGTEMVTVVTGGTGFGCVGYEVHTFEPIRNAQCIPFWIHEHAPQDAPVELYGFIKREQRDLFRRLLKLKGVGPTVAMRIVGSGWQPGTPLPKIRGVGEKIAAALAELI